MTFERIEKPDFDSLYKEYEFHTGITVTLGELYKDGWFNLEDESWDFCKYNETQHKRLCNKILNHYYMRCVGIMPLAAFKREFLRTLNEVVPKYIVLYKKLDEGADLMNAESEYYKARNIYSDYPQTPLGDNQDYASNGNDRQYEKINDGSILDLAAKLENYDDPDYSIVKCLEPCFSSLVTLNMNCW